MYAKHYNKYIHLLDRFFVNPDPEWYQLQVVLKQTIGTRDFYHHSYDFLHG